MKATHPCRYRSNFPLARLWPTENLHHGAGAEDLHDSAGLCFYFRGGVAYVDARDSFDVLPQAIGGVLEDLPMKLLHLSGAIGRLSQSPLAWRERAV
jgi:hypothetical protein